MTYDFFGITDLYVQDEQTVYCVGDVNASCLSFLVAFNLAAALLNQGTYRRIAIVSAEQPSRGLDWDDPEASLIFGDGAAAAIVEKGDEKQLTRSYLLKTFVSGREFCEIRAGGSD